MRNLGTGKSSLSAFESSNPGDRKSHQSPGFIMDDHYSVESPRKKLKLSRIDGADDSVADSWVSLPTSTVMTATLHVSNSMPRISERLTLASPLTSAWMAPVASAAF